MAGETEVTPDEKNTHILRALHKVFGNYRAEWLSKQVFELYQPPHFMLELAQEKPVILQGGRGTGKTTALLAMSYEGRFAIEQKDVVAARKWEYFACYLRMNSSRVGNFR